MSDAKPYARPTVTRLGSLHDLTQYKNKIGQANDVYSNSTGIQGSIVSH